MNKTLTFSKNAKQNKPYRLINGVVSKETVVLHRCGSFINGVDNAVN